MSSKIRVGRCIFVSVWLAGYIAIFLLIHLGGLVRRANEAEQRLKDTQEIVNNLAFDRYFKASNANTLYDPPPNVRPYVPNKAAKITTMNPLYDDAKIEWRNGNTVQSDVLCKGCGLVLFKWTKPGIDFTVTLADGRSFRFRKANVKPDDVWSMDLMVSQCELVPRLYLYHADQFIWPTTGKGPCMSPNNTRPSWAK